MDDFQWRIATIIRSRRQKMKMSQEELADRIGKTPSFIGQLERNESSPSLDTPKALITTLGIDANEIFIGTSTSEEAYNEIHSLMLQMDDHKRAFLVEFARLLFRADL